MRRSDLADLNAFVAIADQRSFRAAASRLGLTPSALSHTMRQLEERLRVRLLNRTTRSVALTDAGCACSAELGRPSSRSLGRWTTSRASKSIPSGRLRLYVSDFAGVAVIARVWGTLFVDLSRRPTGSACCRGAGRHRGKGVRCRDRVKRPSGRGHDRRPRDGTHEGDRGWRASALRTATPAAHVR